MDAKSLLLWIEDNSCSCGFKWTHSYVTYTSGGTPGPQDELKLPVTQIEHSRRNASHCHRCAPLGLGIGWSAPKEPREAAVPPSLSARDELLS